MDLNSMVTVWIPSLLRELTGGEAKLNVVGETVSEVIDHIEDRYPGFRERICVGNSLIQDLSVVVDGEVSQLGLKHRLEDVSEIHFLPVLAGGR